MSLVFNVALYLIQCIKTNELGTVFPQRQIVYSKTSAFILCYSKSKTTWRKGSKKISVRKQLGNHLVLTMLEQRNSGLYTCYGTSDNSSFSATSELLVASAFTLN